MIQHANNTQLDADLQSLANDVDILYQFICAVTVLGMQAGFSLVEAGKIRSCLRSVLTKNIVDVSLCTVCWWALGHGFSKGPISNSFIAVGHPFMLPSNLVRWLWDVSFVSMCVTITSGAMAERTNFVAYLVCVLVHSSFTYPVVSHWMWHEQVVYGGVWVCVCVCVGYLSISLSLSVCVCVCVCSLLTFTAVLSLCHSVNMYFSSCDFL